MYSLDEILRMSVEEKASDIHFTAGCPPYYRIDGVLTPLKGDKLQPTDLEALLLYVYHILQVFLNSLVLWGWVHELWRLL